MACSPPSITFRASVMFDYGNRIPAGHFQRKRRRRFGGTLQSIANYTNSESITE